MYSLNPAIYGSIFALPTSVVDKYIKLASPVALKTLLWLFRNQGGNFSADIISKSIGATENDVNEAFEYWSAEGLLLNIDTNENAVPLKSDTNYIKDEPTFEKKEKPVIPQKQEKTPLPDIKISKPSLEQIIDRIEEDDEIKAMMNVAQSILGRTIGFDTQSSLLMIHDTYGLKPEVILTLLQHCAANGKASTAYIAKLSKSWAEKEINTLALANEYIGKHSNANRLFNELKIITGISTPLPTPSQADYLVSWVDMGFGAEMIALAYEETADRTGKPSFNYMNKILLNWNNSGFKSPSDVENAKKQFKEKNASTVTKKNSYNLDEANEMSHSAPIKYVKKKDR